MFLLAEDPGETEGRAFAAMSTVANRFVVARVLLLVLTWCLAASQGAHGGEFHFTVQDLPDNSAAWLPDQVVIHRETDLRGGLLFILENPTARTHVFFVEGLEEQMVDENGVLNVRPLRVTIAPEETIRAVIATEPFQEVHSDRETEFRFFCPLHRGDRDPGGTIRIVHLGGTIRMVP